MIRATTPTITITINGDVDLTLADEVYVSVTQANTQIELSGDALDVGAKTVSCWLSQEQSLRLVSGLAARVQVNWLYTDMGGVVQRRATEIGSIDIGEQLIKRVLT